MKYHLFAIIALACSLTAQAAFVYHDSASTDGGEFNSTFLIGNLKNGGYTSSTDLEDADLAAGNLSYATKNPPTGGYPVTITLEFDTPASLTAFHLWNHSNAGQSGGTNQGVKAFTLKFYDGPGGTGSQIGASYAANAAKAPATGTYSAQTFVFGFPYLGVRSVVFTADNHNPSSSFIGMREIAFEGSVNFLYHDSALTTGGEFSGSFPIGNLKNAGHGSPGAVEDAGASGESYATTNPATGGIPVTITLEFNSPATLEAFHLWNHSNANGAGAPANGVGDFSLTFHDGPSGTGSVIGLPFSSTATIAPATGTYEADHFNFGTPYAGVRSVVFSIINKQGGVTSGFAAVREIGFTGSMIVVPPATPDKVIVYLVGGQSNADGYGVTSQLSTELQALQPDIDFYHGNGGGNSPLAANQWIRLQSGSGSMGGNAGGFGPELSFGVDIHEALGSEGARIAVIKHTLGGTSLHTDWFPGGGNTTAGDGSVYQAFQTTVSNGLAALASLYPAASIQLEGMIWHQGEADAGNATNAGNYQTNLTNFIADVRATYGSGLKFGIVQLSDNQTILDPIQRSTVKAAQAAVADADPIAYLVTTDDLPMGGASTIHFGTTGNLTIGSRLAAGMQRVPLTDVDGNGLDDAWEEAYWGAGNTGQDPGGDDDKDGLTNLREFLWLTNPLVSNVTSPALQMSPDLSVTWPSSPNRRYMIEASPDLNVWQRLDSFIPGSAGATTSYVLPADPAARRFYRVGVQR